MLAPRMPAALSLPLSLESVVLEEFPWLLVSSSSPVCSLTAKYSLSEVQLLGPLASFLKRMSAQLYRALPESPTVTTWMLAKSPSETLTSEGSLSSSMQSWPGLVTLRNWGVRETLKLVEFSPRPRLTKT